MSYIPIIRTELDSGNGVTDMLKIIAILAVATIIGVITTAILHVAGVDQWWAESIGTSTTVIATIDLMRGWVKSQAI